MEGERPVTTNPNFSAPDALPAQWRLVKAASKNRNLSGGDIAVLIEVIDRYFRDTKRAHASQEQLAEAVGVHKTSARQSLRRLVLHGFLDQVKLGRRGTATEFRPNFTMIPHPFPSGYIIRVTPKGADQLRGPDSIELRQKGSLGATVSADETFGSAETTETPTNGSADATETANFGSVDAIPSYPSPAPQGPAGGWVESPPEVGGYPALLPPSPSPEGAGKGARPGFEKLWKEYAWPHKRPQAKEAWDKLSPDLETIEVILASARRWAAHYAEQATPAKWRVLLHNFIAQERYLEDPPVPRGGPDKAVTKPKLARRAPTTSLVPADVPRLVVVRSSAATTLTPMTATVAQADVVPDDDSCPSVWLQFQVLAGDFAGETFERTIRYRSGDLQTREEAKSDLAALCRAAHIAGKFRNTDVLIGREILVTRQPNGRLFFDEVVLQPQEGVVAA